MKILFGVQGTGNGHISRARAMQPALKKVGIEVDWLFSGRKKSDYFDMAAFGNYRAFKGLSFAHQKGRVNIVKTFAEASLHQMVIDIKTLDLSQYDLVISDFEPVSAWAAKQQGAPCFGLGHQYAFMHDIPKAKVNIAFNALMKWFAPVTLGIGVHWHHFNQPIIPPIIDVHNRPIEIQNKTLVYLPFENADDVFKTLRKVEHPFVLHSDKLVPGQYSNVQVKGFSRDGFLKSLYATDSVICNAGFELVSEALKLGRKIMVKPIVGQVEQHSNAQALEELGYGTTTKQIDIDSINRFIDTAKVCQVDYPDVPTIIANWLKDFPNCDLNTLVSDTWAGVNLSNPIITQGTNHLAA